MVTGAVLRRSLHHQKLLLRPVASTSQLCDGGAGRTLVSYHSRLSGGADCTTPSSTRTFLGRLQQLQTTGNGELQICGGTSQLTSKNVLLACLLGGSPVLKSDHGNWRVGRCGEIRGQLE